MKTRKLKQAMVFLETKWGNHRKRWGHKRKRRILLAARQCAYFKEEGYRRECLNLKREIKRMEACGGALPAEHPCPPRMKISLSRHDLLGKERWPISQRRRARNLFLSGLLLGLFA